jgi:uncharacterized membrane protein
LRPFIVRPRLVGGAAIGLLSFLLLPRSLSLPARGLIAWDCGVVLFLVLTAYAMVKADHAALRRRALRHDEGRNFILLLAIGAAMASITAIATELASAKGQGAPLELLHVLLTGATITLSWIFVQTIFALHYASGYYGPPRLGEGHCRGGLAFPGDEDPDYWDFFHFAVIIGATAQTADISILSKEMRRICTVHSLIAFAFNTAILALMNNLAAGLF